MLSILSPLGVRHWGELQWLRAWWWAARLSPSWILSGLTVGAAVVAWQLRPPLLAGNVFSFPALTSHLICNGLKQQQSFIISHDFCGPRFQEWLVRHFWLKVPRRLGLDGSYRVCFHGGSLTRLQGGTASAPLHMGLYTGLLECPHNIAAGFPQSQWSKRAKQSSNIFYDLALEAAYRHVHSILLIT